MTYERVVSQAERYAESYKTRSEEVQIAVKHTFINGAKEVNLPSNKRWYNEPNRRNR